MKAPLIAVASFFLISTSLVGQMIDAAGPRISGPTLTPLGTTFHPLGTGLGLTGTTFRPLGSTFHPTGTMTIHSSQSTFHPAMTPTIHPLGPAFHATATTTAHPLGSAFRPALTAIVDTDRSTFNSATPTRPETTQVDEEQSIHYAAKDESINLRDQGLSGLSVRSSGRLSNSQDILPKKTKLKPGRTSHEPSLEKLWLFRDSA